MSGLPHDINAKVAAALASGDKASAADLAGQIAAAQASGSAFGFDDDLAKLRALAGTDGLGKRAPALAKRADDDPFAGLPIDLAARARSTLAFMKRAETPADLCRAKSDGERLVADLDAFGAMRKATGKPVGFGAAEMSKMFGGAS